MEKKKNRVVSAKKVGRTVISSLLLSSLLFAGGCSKSDNTTYSAIIDYGDNVLLCEYKSGRIEGSSLRDDEVWYLRTTNNDDLYIDPAAVTIVKDEGGSNKALAYAESCTSGNGTVIRWSNSNIGEVDRGDFTYSAIIRDGEKYMILDLKDGVLEGDVWVLETRDGIVFYKPKIDVIAVGGIDAYGTAIDNMLNLVSEENLQIWQGTGLGVSSGTDGSQESQEEPYMLRKGLKTVEQ